MAKFNKDTFLNEITGKVQSAIDKNLITKEDIQNKDMDRLHGFIQYELLEYIEDRKFAIDVLKDFNYDEKAPWEDIQEHFGTFKSLMDIALVNLWKFLDSEGATQYEYYNNTAYDPDSPMLDLAHDLEDKAPYEDEDDDGYSYERPKLNRKIRLANQEDEPGEQDESYEPQYESANFKKRSAKKLNESALDNIDYKKISLYELVNIMIDEGILEYSDINKANDYFDKYYVGNLSDAKYQRAKKRLLSLQNCKTILIGDDSAYSTYVKDWFDYNFIDYNFEIYHTNRRDEVDYFIAGGNSENVFTLFGGNDSGDDTCFLIVGIK